MKRALITGITGQDGSYLSELLLEKGYEVHGLIRPSTTRAAPELIAHLLDRITLHEGDLTDQNSVMKIVRDVKPHEIYNLAAQSHVGKSFDVPGLTADATAKGFLNVLESARQCAPSFQTKIYQASTSELFGNVIRDSTLELDETTSFEPASPYAVSKLFSHHMARVYRQSYNMFVCCGILFNHESPRRGKDFVTQKVCRAAVDIKRGKIPHLTLGNVHAWRDWGHAKDYVRGMHMMMQHSQPDDFVLATGVAHSVEELVDVAFKYAGLDPKVHLKTNSANVRPNDVHYLVGNASKARTVLGWKPEIDFETMIREMIDEYERSTW